MPLHVSAPSAQIGQLNISLKSVLDQWSLYKRASEEINGHLMEGRYSVSRFRLLTGSLEAVQLQVQSLQVCLHQRAFLSPKIFIHTF